MERMTNCKRIHMMNYEELAKFLLNLSNWDCDVETVEIEE